MEGERRRGGEKERGEREKEKEKRLLIMSSLAVVKRGSGARLNGS